MIPSILSDLQPAITIPYQPILSDLLFNSFDSDATSVQN